MKIKIAFIGANDQLGLDICVTLKVNKDEIIALDTVLLAFSEKPLAMCSAALYQQIIKNGQYPKTP